MKFTFFCLVIFPSVLFVNALYSKDVSCIIDQNSVPICETIKQDGRRSNINYNIPTYEPYLPNAKNLLFYNCSAQNCKKVKIYSITQLASPKSFLRYCYLRKLEEYKCEPLKYYHYKNLDKLLFLSNNLPNKLFYMIDCLVYTDSGRVCHKKDDVDSYTKLVDIGNIARPNESNVFSQDDFICEESEDKKINCDYDGYVPYPDGLKPKVPIEIDKKLLLKTDGHLVMLKYNCLESWCGYSGAIEPTRRVERYEPPGGKVYRCYYAKKQQICKRISGSELSLYSARDWIST